MALWLAAALAQELHDDGSGEYQDDLEQSFGGEDLIESGHCTAQGNIRIL
jgi:hypothetical protein